MITSGLASERAFVGANAVQLERLFDDLVALARRRPARPTAAAPIEHEDVQAQLADARVQVQEVQLIVRDTVERILVDDEHPSDGPVAKLAYTEMDVALCELALELIAVGDVDRRRRRRRRRPLVPQLPLEPSAHHLRRRVGDHARPDRPPAPRPPPSLKDTTMPTFAEDHAEISNLLARYCILLDLHDVEGWVALFTPDATYHVYGRTFTGHDGLRKMLSRAPGGLHLGGPAMIESIDGDRAHTAQNLLFIEQVSARAAPVALPRRAAPDR